MVLSPIKKRKESLVLHGLAHKKIIPGTYEATSSTIERLYVAMTCTNQRSV